MSASSLCILAIHVYAVGVFYTRACMYIMHMYLNSSACMHCWYMCSVVHAFMHGTDIHMYIRNNFSAVICVLMLQLHVRVHTKTARWLSANMLPPAVTCS